MGHVRDAWERGAPYEREELLGDALV
ncbi:MAG: hypothetical protein JWR64_1486, partial [Marmoricola sp.]|nr:hypothetical protein [Marmoricola sp.]